MRLPGVIYPGRRHSARKPVDSREGKTMLARRCRWVPCRRPAHCALVCLALLAGCRGRTPHEGKSAAQLEAMLRSADPAVQAQGAYGLSRLGAGAQPAVPALTEALRSKETLVRENAALALAQIGPDAREAVRALTELLGDPEWTVRRQAALALGQIGPDARAAIPALIALTQDRDHLVRKAAQEALAKIRR